MGFDSAATGAGANSNHAPNYASSGRESDCRTTEHDGEWTNTDARQKPHECKTSATAGPGERRRAPAAETAVTKFAAATHVEVQPYRCGTCQKSFRTSDYLKRHITRVHEKRMLCRTCFMPFSTRRCMLRHERSLHGGSGRPQLACPICFKILSGHLARHVLVHTGEKSFVCDICVWSFRGRCSLIDHRKTHAEENGTAASSPQPYRCGTCPKSFRTSDYMKRHITRVHEKRVLCRTCSMSFSTRSCMLLHERTHGIAARPPVKCPICFKILSGHLARHVMVHTGERPFVCDICLSSFRRRCRLIAHRKTHVEVNGTAANWPQSRPTSETMRFESTAKNVCGLPNDTLTNATDADKRNSNQNGEKPNCHGDGPAGGIASSAVGEKPYTRDALCDTGFGIQHTPIWQTLTDHNEAGQKRCHGDEFDQRFEELTERNAERYCMTSKPASSNKLVQKPDMNVDTAENAACELETVESQQPANVMVHHGNGQDQDEKRLASAARLTSTPTRRSHKHEYALRSLKGKSAADTDTSNVVRVRERTFTCGNCDASFGCKDQLKIHMYRIHNSKYICKYCERRFRHSCGRWLHVMRVHPDLEEVTCTPGDSHVEENGQAGNSPQSSPTNEMMRFVSTSKNVCGPPNGILTNATGTDKSNSARNGEKPNCHGDGPAGSNASSVVGENPYTRDALCNTGFGIQHPPIGRTSTDHHEAEQKRRHSDELNQLFEELTERNAERYWTTAKPASYNHLDRAVVVGTSGAAKVDPAEQRNERERNTSLDCASDSDTVEYYDNCTNDAEKTYDCCNVPEELMNIRDDGTPTTPDKGLQDAVIKTDSGEHCSDETEFHAQYPIVIGTIYIRRPVTAATISVFDGAGINLVKQENQEVCCDGVLIGDCEPQPVDQKPDTYVDIEAAASFQCTTAENAACEIERVDSQTTSGCDGTTTTWKRSRPGRRKTR